MANVKITTGQYVTIEQKVASVSDRVFAQMLDWGFIWLYCLFISILLMIVGAIQSEQESSFFDKYLVFIYFIVSLPIIFYHPICEFFFNGASPGKKILKIKVVHKDGSSPSLGSFLMRWIMFLPECLLLPGISLLCIIFNKNCQRIGDMMAGTVVVKISKSNTHYIDTYRFGYVNDQYVPTYEQAASLSLRQVEVIRETLYLNNSNRFYYINRLSDKVRDYLGVPPLLNNDNELFLRTIADDYSYYSSRIEI